MVVEIILWILLVLLIAVLAIYGVSAYWFSRAGDVLKAVFTRLRGLRAEIETKRAAGAAYSAVDPEPFGSLAKSHAQKLAEIETAYKVLLAKYGDAQQQYRKLYPPQGIGILKLPVEALNLRKAFTSIADGEAALKDGLVGVDAATEKLKQMGWTVAQQVRQSLETLRSTMSTFAGLQQEGLNDPVLDNALGRGKRWDEAFTDQAPVVVLSGSQEEVLNASDKAMIAQVHGLVSSAEPDIEDLTGKANEWKQKQISLRKALAELPDRYRAASSGTAALEAAPEHPVQWDLSREPLAKAREQIQRMGDAQKTRSLDQLDSDKGTAEELVHQLTEIEQRVQAASSKHKEFLELLARPEVNTGVEWLRNMVKLVERVDGYNPDNWPRELKVEMVRADFETMANLHRSLAFDSIDKPILESKLDSLLEKARNLSLAHEELRPRAASIEARLAVISEVERDAKDKLSRSKALLNQAASLVASCPSLGSAAVSEAESLRASIDPLVADLDHPAQGLVEAKIDRAEAILHKSELTASRWREKVSADLEARRASLSAKVAAINEIAMLEDPVIQDAARFVRESSARVAPMQEKKTLGGGARNLLDKLPGFGESRRENRSAEDREATTPGLAGSIQQIKMMNDELQNCLISLRKVEEVEEPIVTANRQAEEARADALQLAARGAELSPEGKSWPPSAVTLVNERGQLALLEDRWQKVKETPSKAMSLVSALGTLSGDYRIVSGNMRTLLDRIQQDHGRFTDLEHRMEEAVREWERIARSPESDRTAQEEIRELIDTSRKEHDDLVQRYLRSATTYNQAHQNLRLIVQRLEGAQIDAGDGSFLELMEKE